jgi:hypothetical protein
MSCSLFYFEYEKTGVELKKLSRLLKLLVITISITILLSCTVASSNVKAESTPNWLKKGAFAQYSFYSPGITFYNGTFLNLNNNTLSTFRWECVNLNGTTARIAVTVKGVSPNGTICSIATEVNIDASSRSVYLNNGSLIGTSHLWLPLDPSPNDPITLWDIPPDKVQFTIIDRDEKAETCQGLQKSFTLSGTATGLKKIGFHGNLSYIIMCDYDTGVLIDNANNMGDEEGTLKALDIMFISVEGRFRFSDTNINLGPSATSSNTNDSLDSLLLIIPFPILLVIFVVAIFVKIKQSHRNSRKRKS